MKIRWTRERRAIGFRIGRWWFRFVCYRMDDYDAMLNDLATDRLVFGRAFVRVAPDEVREL